MRLTLDQAVDLALKQNHSVRLRALSVEQMQSKKDEARSNYMPQIKASGSTLHVTELAGIEIPAGAFGSYPSTGPVPTKSLFIDQGVATAYTGGVGLEQPAVRELVGQRPSVGEGMDRVTVMTEHERRSGERTPLAAGRGDGAEEEAL